MNTYGVSSTTATALFQSFVFASLVRAGSVPFPSFRLPSVRMFKRFKEMKYGRLLRGPVLVSPKGFNRAINGDGVGFQTTESKDLMRIPQRAEGQHIELMGDSGTGKT